MRQPWFRLYGDMIDDPKIGKLTDHEFRTWIELLCLACQSESDGGDTGMTIEEIEWRLRRKIGETLHVTFIETGLVTLCNGHVTITNWNKRQRKSDSSAARVRKYRENKRKKNANATVTLHETGVTRLEAEAEAETDNKTMSGTRIQAKEILRFLNTKAKKNYQPVDANIKPIQSRLKEYGPDKLRQMIAIKCRQWIDDDVMSQYLRPATLFNATKCAQYIGEIHE